jgi:biotin operon repressor
LVNERNELVRMIANVEAIIQAHIKRLEELGVKVKNKKEE